jgi:hypothetical protein
VGIPTFENHNGRMMEDGGGASLIDLRVRDGKRLSVFSNVCLSLYGPAESDRANDHRLQTSSDSLRGL